jgi:hypothetical protein
MGIASATRLGDQQVSDLFSLTAALADSGGAMPFTQLRASCRVRVAALYECLAAPTATGRIAKTNAGYCLTDS